MDLTNIQLPPPSNWQDFESLCCDIWAVLWQDINTKKHGRSGQEQSGVDVYGTRQCDGELCAVQCKGKDNYQDKNLSDTELRNEIEKAKKFTPPISEFVLATSGRSDVNIQKIAREITAEHNKTGLFPVHIWSWDDIRLELAKPRQNQTFRTHYPQLANFNPTDNTIGDSAKETIEIVKESRTATLEASADIAEIKQLLISSRDSTDLIEEYQFELDEYRNLIRQNKPAQALELLEALKNRASERSEHIQYRIHTNIGSCLLKLERFNEASAAFLEALKHNTGKEKEKALCNAAYGYYLLHDLPNARTLIKQALTEFPDYPQAHVIDLVIRAKDTPFEQLEQSIPEKVKETEEVQFALGMQALQKGLLPEAESYLETAYAIKKENNIELSATLGSVIIENLFSNDRLKIARKYTPKQSQKLQRAEQLLLEAWNGVGEEDFKTKKAVWLQNIAQIKRIRGEYKEAEQYIKQALSYKPDFGEFKKILALIYYESEQKAAALKVIEEVDDTANEEVVLLKADLYRLNEKIPEAIAYLSSKIESVTDNELREEALCFLIKLLTDKGEFEQIDTLVKESESQFPDSAKIITAYSESLDKQGKKKEGAASLDKIYQDVLENGSLTQRLYLANQYYRLDENDKAASLYELVTDKTINSEFTQKLLISLFEAGQHKKVIEIAEALVSSGQNSRTITKILCSIYANIGSYQKAIDCCDNYLSTNQDDIEITLLRAELGTWVGEEIDLTIRPEALATLSPDSIIRYVSILLRRQRLKEAVEAMYCALQYHGDNAELNLKYCGLILVYAKGTYDWLDAGEIKEGTAAVIKPDSTDAAVVYLLSEMKNHPANGSIVINPSDALAKRLIGKKTGDRVIIKDDRFFKKEGSIIEVKAKYILLLHHILETFEMRFPEHSGLNRMNFSKIDQEGNTTIDIDKFFEINRQLNRHTKEAIEEYSNLRIPVMFLGRLSGKGSLDSFYAAIGDFSLIVRCCDGSIGERQTAIQHLTVNAKGIIMDYTAIVTLFETGLEEQAKKLPNKIVVTQSTLNAFMEFKEEQILNMGGYGHIGEDAAGQMYVTEISVTQVEKFVGKLERIIVWIKANCEVVAATSTLDFDVNLAERLNEIFGKPTAETIIEAQARGLLLFSDDHVTRLFAQSLYHIPGVWSQAAYMWLQQKGTLSKTLYNQATIELALRRYNYTSIDADVLFQLFVGEGHVHTRRFLFVLSTLGKSEDGKSCVVVASEFIDHVWHSGCHLMIKRNVVGTVFEMLKRAHDGQIRIASTSMLLRSQSTYHKQIAQAILDWREGLITVPDLEEIFNLA